MPSRAGVTPSRIALLLVQVVLNAAAFDQVRHLLTGSAWPELRMAAAVGLFLVAIVMALAGLDPMLRATEASAVYSALFVLVAGGIALVAGLFTLVFAVYALSMLPFGFFVRDAFSFGFSVTAGVAAAVTLGTGAVALGSYAGVAGTLAVRILLGKKPIPPVREPAPPMPLQRPTVCPVCPATPARASQLTHLDLLSSSGGDPEIPGSQPVVRTEIRCCPKCSTVWWIQVEGYLKPIDGRALTDDPGRSTDPEWAVRESVQRSTPKDSLLQAGKTFGPEAPIVQRLAELAAAQPPPWKTL